MRVSKAWQMIEDWYAANAPNGLPGLREGATAHDIRNAERDLGIEFPDEVRQSYELHNGSKNAVFPYGYYLLSLEEIVDEREVWCNL
ncbi:MAG: SMI1/KNR4 family protein, partial [Planctomycetaceae bacterium]|nr:SMI1/KNR4 family protein [Planctomycetaceae bacterium]